MSAKKQSKKTQSKKSFIITYDCPNTAASNGKNKRTAIEKNLNQLGKVEVLFAPKSTVRLWPNKKKKASKQVRKALSRVLEANQGSALIIDQSKGKIWTWREKAAPQSGKARPAKWIKRA